VVKVSSKVYVEISRLMRHKITESRAGDSGASTGTYILYYSTLRSGRRYKSHRRSPAPVISGAVSPVAKVSESDRRRWVSCACGVLAMFAALRHRSIFVTSYLGSYRIGN
jgi:hypothetical protein